MHVNLLEISGIAFSVSFIFALGGLGSAVGIIPILVFLGIPFPIARSAGLFTNFISTSSVTFYNMKRRLIDFKTAIPIILSSIIIAPLGAYVSHYIPERIVGIVFSLFLFFAGIMIYLPKKQTFKENTSIIIPVLIGTLAGFLSGFLGIGGGGIMSPLLVLTGFNPKKVVAIVAFAVPFSSLTAFLAYLKMGNTNWSIVLSTAIPALFAGYIAGYITDRYLKPQQIKKILGIIFFILGIKFLTKFF